MKTPGDPRNTREGELRHRAKSFWPLIERHCYNVRRGDLAAHGNTNRRARHIQFRWHVRETDVLFQKWRGTAASDGAHLALAIQHSVAVTRDQSRIHRESSQDAIDALLFLFYERIAAQKIAFIDFADPREVGFPRRCRIVDFMAVERHAR